MAYIKINNAFFDDTSGQLQVVNDPATLRGLQTGAIASKVQPAISGGADRFASPELTLPDQRQETTLPQGNEQPNKLLDFKDTLSKVIDLARNKRNKMSLEFMGGVAPAGTMMASDFNSILGNLNRASEGFTSDVLERAFPEEEKDDILSVSDAKSLGVPFGTTVSQASELGITPTTPADEKDDTPTTAELKAFINSQIASPEFQALSPEDKDLYIRSQGGNPYDYQPY